MSEIVQRDVSLEWRPFDDLLLLAMRAAVRCWMIYVGEIIVQPFCALGAVMIVVVAAVVPAELLDIIMNSFGADAFQQCLDPGLVAEGRHV